jgi:hypothetical protein
MRGFILYFTECIFICGRRKNRHVVYTRKHPIRHANKRRFRVFDKEYAGMCIQDDALERDAFQDKSVPELSYIGPRFFAIYLTPSGTVLL